MLEYLGRDVPDPLVAYAAPGVDQMARERYLAEWTATVRRIADEPD